MITNPGLERMIREAYLSHPIAYGRRYEMDETDRARVQERHDVYTRCVALAVGFTYPHDPRDQEGNRIWREQLTEVRRIFDEAVTSNERAGLAILRIIFALTPAQETAS